MRQSELRRKTRLQAKTKLRTTAKIRAVNAGAQAKRRKRYAAKLRLTKQGEGYRQAMERADGRCEFLIRDTTPEALTPTYDPPMAFGRYTRWAWSKPFSWRCMEVGTKESPLHAHHLTYARFGGDELPEDLLICCKAHHDYLESQHPTRKHRVA